MNSGSTETVITARLHASMPPVVEPRVVVVSHVPPTLSVVDDLTGLVLCYRLLPSAGGAPEFVFYGFR